MTVDHFFDLLLKELEINPELKGYYRFLNNPSLFAFRKSYYCQRLQFIADHIQDPSASIFDLGCGFGTTAIFLTLNGFKVTGNTIEFYSEQIEKRRQYWSQFGDLSNFTVKHENIFDKAPAPEAYRYIIVQDVLHHLEPIEQALQIIQHSLNNNGKLVVCEENGKNLMNRIKLYLQRGSKRIITIHDDKLNKDILLGNENIRTLKQWDELLAKSNLHIDNNTISYIRYYLPGAYKNKTIEEVNAKEQALWKASACKRDYCFHGLNFVATKTQ